MQRDQDEMLQYRKRPGGPFWIGAPLTLGPPAGGAVLHRQEEAPDRPSVTYRRAGDRYMLIEFGPNVLDFGLRLRAHALAQRLQKLNLPGILDLTEGIRSLQVCFDGQTLNEQRLLAKLIKAEADLPGVDEVEVPSRIVHMPLSWDDPATQLAIEKYMQSVRDDAPWCPSNLEFIRRVNGLSDIEEVRRIVFEASYLVLGLGDVYLGAPVASPLDPRHRLVTTKYNPARTWTPENAVGIGGAYLCVYGMEGPGGYQFVGRTVPVFNTYRQTADFTDGKPWLLRLFDQLRFYPVSQEQLLELRRDVRLGRTKLQVEPTTFRLADHRRFLAQNADAIEAFRAKQREAFAAERQKWVAAGEFATAEAAEPINAPPEPALDLPEGAEVIEAPLGANVWKVLAKPDQTVQSGEPVLVLEAMKMETTIHAPVSGRVLRVVCQKGQLVSPGSPLLVIEPSEATTPAGQGP
jgi:urea carboxylase